MEHKCLRCGRDLHADEIALYRKLVMREATHYLCLDCLASDLSTSAEKLKELIDYFRNRQKCCLFV